MKKGIHPNYQTVIVEDTSCGFKFLTRMTKTSEDTAVWEDGNEYPVIKVAISSESHPFYTGENRFVDEAGRVEKFKKKFGLN